MKIPRIHLGEIVRQKCSELGFSNAEFARKIGIHRQNIVKTVFEKESLDTNLLCLISEVLDCNLFDYFQSTEAKKELKATITIEMGAERKDRTVRFVFGENDIKL